MNIQRCIEWNEAYGNKRGDINPKLESKMLAEELNETQAGLDGIKIHGKLKGWNTEVIDGCIDIMFVAIGTLHKLGLTADEIDAAWNAVCDSNDSKQPFEKDGNGKVMKSENWRPPVFEGIITSVDVYDPPTE